MLLPYIAKVAAKLAVGYTLDELDNDITGGKTPASFEPSIDYVVTKIPRFAFEKFPKADDRLTTQMKSVGEVMAIGSTFQESLQKALRGLETDKVGLDPMVDLGADDAKNKIRSECITARGERIFYLADAFRLGMSLDEVFDLSKVDPWFLAQIQDIVSSEMQVNGSNIIDIDARELFLLKRKGFSDARLAQL
jgi:carbamoyl-phosphate synthase large subunit